MQHPTDSTTQASTAASVYSGKRKSAQQKLTDDSKAIRTADGGEALFDVVREVWRWRKDAKKRPTGKKLSSQRTPGEAEPAPLIAQEIDSICQSLIDGLEQFRTTQLPPLNIDDFSGLRDEHVLPA